MKTAPPKAKMASIRKPVFFFARKPISSITAASASAAPREKVITIAGSVAAVMPRNMVLFQNPLAKSREYQQNGTAITNASANALTSLTNSSATQQRNCLLVVYWPRNWVP